MHRASHRAVTRGVDVFLAIIGGIVRISGVGSAVGYFLRFYIEIVLAKIAGRRIPPLIRKIPWFINFTIL
jgi:hypothetical protein